MPRDPASLKVTGVVAGVSAQHTRSIGKPCGDFVVLSGAINKRRQFDSQKNVITEQGCCACLQMLQQQHVGDGRTAARKPPGKWGMTAEGRATHYPVPQIASDANDEVCRVCWQGVRS